MAKQVEEKRKSYVAIMLFAVGCLVAGFYLLHYLFFDPTVREAVKADGEWKTAAADGKTAGDKTADGKSAEPVKTADKPAGDAGKTAEASKSAETTVPAVKDAAPAGTTDAASAIDLKPTGEVFKFNDTARAKDAAKPAFPPLSVGSADKKDGFTAVFTDRGGVLAALRYVGADGKNVYSRSPVDPGARPDSSSRDEALLLLGPAQVLPTWSWSSEKGDWVPGRPAEFETAFPDEVSPEKDPALFAQLWPDGALPLEEHDKSDDGRAAFGFEGNLAWLNTRQWVQDKVAESEAVAEPAKQIAFSYTVTDDAGKDVARFRKVFTAYPGFKIVCTIGVTNLTGAKDAGPGAPFRAPLNIFGPCGIRQDLYKPSNTAGPVGLYVSAHGDSYKDYEGHFGSPIEKTFSNYAEEIGESAYLRKLPADHLFGADSKEYRPMLVGLSTGYFLAVLGPDDLPEAGTGASIKRLKGLGAEGTVVATTYNFPDAVIAPQESVTKRICMYAGPRDRKAVDTAFAIGNPLVTRPGGVDDHVGWAGLVSYGWTGFIAGPITALLRWLVEIIGSAGLAIICLTLIVRLAISPLSVKAQKTMQIHGHKMRQIKPKLDAVKEKYKGDKSREAQLLQFQETRAVMKSNNVSMIPIGGCLILLLQMPIFFALYASVRTSFMLRHEDFLWISDLARPDALLGSIQKDWIILGANGFITLNILPIIWAALLIVQQWSQPAATDPQQARMQKQMAFIMPLMGLMFYNMPAGFTLYFVASSIYSFGESRLVKWWLIRKGLIDRHAGVTMGASM